MEELKPLEEQPEGYTVSPDPEELTDNILSGITAILHYDVGKYFK